MGGNDFLIGFQAAGKGALASLCSMQHHGTRTHAPPELSEPATTRILFILVFDGGDVPSLLELQG